MGMAHVDICCSECGEPVDWRNAPEGGPVWHVECEPLWIKRLRAECAQWQEASGQAAVRAEQLEDALSKMERERDEARALLQNIHQLSSRCRPLERQP